MASIATVVLVGTDQTSIDASIISALELIWTGTDTAFCQIVEYESQGETQALTHRFPIQGERRTLEDQRSPIEAPVRVFTADNA